MVLIFKKRIGKLLLSVAPLDVPRLSVMVMLRFHGAVFVATAFFT